MSLMVSDCGREGPLCAVLELWASLCGLHLLCRFAAGTLVPSRSVNSAAVASFGCHGFFVGSLLDLCVEFFSRAFGVGYFFSTALLWHIMKAIQQHF